MSTPGPVHLVAASELGWRFPSTVVAVCGEQLSEAPACGDPDEPRYCPACVAQATRWCATAVQPVASR